MFWESSGLGVREEESVMATLLGALVVAFAGLIVGSGAWP